MIDSNFYKDYFANIARTLKDIAHSDIDKRFYYLDNTESPEPIVSALKNEISSPALVLDQFTDHISSLQSDNYQQFLTGGFAILVLSNPGNLSSTREAKNTARNIALKILARMRQDAFEGPLSEEYVFQELEFSGEDIGPIGGRYYGWHYEFKWRSPVDLCLNPEDWQDQA